MKKDKFLLMLIGVILLMLVILIIGSSNALKEEENYKENTVINNTTERKSELNVDLPTKISIIKNVEKVFELINASSEGLSDVLDSQVINDNINEVDKVSFWKYIDIELVDNNDSVYLYSYKYESNNGECELLIKVYNDGFTYSIYPDEYVKKNGYKANLEKPLQNDNNIFEFYQDSDYDRISLYLNNFKYNMTYSVKDSFSFLDEDYSKSFENMDEYEEFVERFKEDPFLILDYKKEDNRYNVRTTLGNTFTIEENDFMDFTIALDSYRVPDENYSKMANEDKGKYIAENFIEMIKVTDYESVYNILNQDFKNNYFNSIEEFEEFAKNNFKPFESYSMNSVGGTVSKLYQYKIITKDLIGKNIQEINLIVKLIDNESYEVSFSIVEH